MTLLSHAQDRDHEFMTKHITVGYDGSLASAAAVQWAADQAQSRGASLRIMTYFGRPVASAELMAYGYGYGEVLSSVEDAAREQLQAVADNTIASHPGLPVTAALTTLPITVALVEGLQADDLVVVGASRHLRAAAFWLGSTPRMLVRHSPCPVAIVRGPATSGRPERVVVGVDGSVGALRALEWAGDEADRQQAELVIVHGWTYPYIALDTSSAQARDLTRVDAACTLDRAIEHAAERFATAATPCLVEASATSALLSTVRDGDLLVLGSRGRGTLSSSIFGSTVNAVLEQAAIPVVVVHSDQEQTDE